MSLTVFSNVVTILVSHVDDILNHFVFKGYQALAGALKYPLGLSMALYVMFIGISITNGFISMSYKLLIQLVLKLSVIYTLALNWDFFSAHILTLIESGASELGSVVLKGAGFGFRDHHGILNGLQLVLNEYVKMGHYYISQGGWTNLMPLLDGLIVWILGVLITATAMMYILLSKIMLAILFISSPLFFVFKLYQSTAAIFDRWFGYILSYAFLMFFISVLLGLVIGLVNGCIVWANGPLSAQLRTYTIIPVFIVTLIGIFMMKRVSLMAIDIGSSLSMQIFSLPGGGASRLSTLVSGMIRGGHGSFRKSLKKLTQLQSGRAHDQSRKENR